MLQHAACNLCGWDRPQEMFVKESWRIVRCGRCGLVYNDPQLSPSQAKALYSQGYFASHSDTFGYYDYLANRKNLSLTAVRRLEAIESFWPQKGSLLDAGCAAGFFLEVARRRGWDVYGGDVSAFASQYARQHLGLKTVGADMQEAPFKDGAFDVVTMWDFIEQVPEPRRALMEAHRILRADGLAVLSFQDVGSLLARISGAHWPHFKPQEKFTYFTPQTMAQMLEKTGFAVQRLSSAGGRYCSMAFLAKKVRVYSPTLSRWADGVLTMLGLEERSFYLNLWDVKVVYARKRLGG